MPEENIGQVTEDLTKQIEAAVSDVVQAQNGGESTEEKSEQQTEVIKQDTKEEENAGDISTGDSGGDDAVGSVDSGSESSASTDKVDVDEQEILSDETLARAISAGIPLSDALSFPSEKSLDRVISAMERKQEQATKRETPKEETSDDPFASLPKLDPEQYDPEVIKYLETLTGTLKKQQEELREFRAVDQQRERYGREQQAREVETWFDKQVESLGEIYKEALGSGRYRSLNPGSQQYKTREEIAETMSVMLSGYNSQGKTPPPREEVFNMAVGMVLRDKIETIHGAKVAKELEARSTQHIRRAGGRKAEVTRTPEEEAAEALKTKFGV